MFKKILIANRGEIAIRILKACQELNIQTVAVYSNADIMSPHVHLATEAISLGDPAATESYLNIPKIIEAAQKTNAEAIHPGYGFLAENPIFAQECHKAGLIFIGPQPGVIEQMGNKIEAKQCMEKAGVPVIPGYHGTNQDTKFLARQGEKIGFPIIVKAAAGGGGKGMRIVQGENELAEAIEGAKRVAQSAFGNSTIFLERYLDKPRHIEFQILGDQEGNIIHLFERECSIQRRHQKIIEESPSPLLTPPLQEKMGKDALAAAQAVDYTNAGTIEFMVDGSHNYYFMEMNTRLQVEHPITEATTGIDIVKWQLRIAAGEPLTLTQTDITQRGHAIECRIYAEDPNNGFLPSSGHLTQVEPPSGPNIRNDMGIETGIDIPPYYDPLMAKLIVTGETRPDAIEKMINALTHYVIIGVTTNIHFLKEILDHPRFRQGDITTHFIDTHFKEHLATQKDIPLEAILALSIYDTMHATPTSHKETPSGVTDPYSPWKQTGKWRISDIHGP